MLTGMPCVCNYERFSITDIARFERRLIKWCKQECIGGKSMLIFDRSALKLDVKVETWDEKPENYYKIVLHNISLVYMQIAGTAMCIAYKVLENNTQSVLYNMPSKWTGTELWLCE